MHLCLAPKLSYHLHLITTTMTNEIKILLIDDHEINSLFTGYMFNKLGIAFDIATNEQQAINLIQNNKYTVVLLDIQMPNNNGYKLAEAVRQYNHKVPLIAFTSLPEKEVLPQAIQSGMSDYMLKPNGMQELRKMIDSYKLSA